MTTEIATVTVTGTVTEMTAETAPEIMTVIEGAPETMTEKTMTAPTGRGLERRTPTHPDPA